MGSDAEYQMGLDAEAAAQGRLERQSQLDSPCRPLYCWVDDEVDCIWDWEPATRILDLLDGLHTEHGLGSLVFLSVDIPRESEIDGDLTRYFATSSEEATFEVIILSHDDEVVLEALQADLSAPGRSAREVVTADMLGEIAQFIESQPERDRFVFARTI